MKSVIPDHDNVLIETDKGSIKPTHYWRKQFVVANCEPKTWVTNNKKFEAKHWIVWTQEGIRMEVRDSHFKTAKVVA